jgi:hypothetical protein
MTRAGAIIWLKEAAAYFERRAAGGEDRAHWSNVANAESCRKIIALLSDGSAATTTGQLRADQKDLSALASAERASRLEAALRRIERWEMPPTNDTWEDGSPMSYAALYGSLGEQQVIREIARQALNSEGESKAPGAPDPGGSGPLSPSPSRDMIYRFFQLRLSEKRDILSALGLADDKTLPEFERFKNAFIAAKEAGKLEAMALAIAEKEASR